MGSFSWLKADDLTKVANIAIGEPFKFLIPKEFGGGFIKDHYQDYGYLGTKEDGSPKYDMYEILAFWNSDMKLPYKPGFFIENDLLYVGDDSPSMKEMDEYTNHNRHYGIQIGCYDNEIAQLKYPLKLVSASYKGTYEDCENYSINDPAQGFYKLYRNSKEYKEYLAEIEKDRAQRKEKSKQIGKQRVSDTKALLERELFNKQNEMTDVINELESDNLSKKKKVALNEKYLELDNQIQVLKRSIEIIEECEAMVENDSIDS